MDKQLRDLLEELFRECDAADDDLETLSHRILSLNGSSSMARYSSELHEKVSEVRRRIRELDLEEAKRAEGERQRFVNGNRIRTDQEAARG